MKKGDMLFVYGTLLPGERADLAKSRMQFDIDVIGPDEINGMLYHLGGFPGLKLVGTSPEETFVKSGPIVKGHVFLLMNSSVAAILDCYEGYRPDEPDRGLYNRTKVLTAHGRNVWTYIYNHPVTEDQLIETGDWKNPRLATTRKPPQYGMRSY